MATTPILNLEAISETLLSCLCNAVAVRPNPPAHCCFRIGEQISHDADIFGDLCCQGLAYVALGTIFPVINSFQQRSIAGTQANDVCAIPSWSVGYKLGIVRCSPVGTDTTMPSCADWNAAATQEWADAQSLAEAVCCFRAAWKIADPGMSMLIAQSNPTSPQGGCYERFITVEIQTENCPEC